MEDKVANPDKMGILQAIRFAVPAWRDEVKPVTIANCFRHCRIRSVALVPANQQLPVGQEGAVSAEDLIGEENLLDQKVIKELESQEHLPTEADNATADEDDSEELPSIPVAEVQSMIQSLETFWMQQADTEDHFMTTLQRMRDKVRAIKTCQMVQQGIQSYFTRS
ncbi:hypothetical protein BASA62_003809 [Batrachochytrium salamandrivorans]|nr:hypothetical protein BASA62_003809 [Batrachochytrium salamandrivorans]